MKRSFMRSRNDAKLCLAAGPYLRRPLNFTPPAGDGSKPHTYVTLNQATHSWRLC